MFNQLSETGPCSLTVTLTLTYNPIHKDFAIEFWETALMYTFSLISIRGIKTQDNLEVKFNWETQREFECTQTLFVALLDGPLDEDLDLFVSLEEAVLELAGLLSTHPEDP